MKKKVLFILSDDYGELVFFRLFMLNQAFTPYVILSETLYKSLDIEGVEKIVYQYAQTVIATIQKIQPDVVCIFSAYLLIAMEKMSWEELMEIIDELKKHNIPIITSDPFCNLFNNMGEYEADASTESAFLRNMVRKETHLLSDLTHLYEVPCNNGNVNSISFWNKAKLSVDSNQNDGSRQWTYILSSSDLNLQLKQYGEGFYNLMAQHILKVITVEMNAVNIIGPTEFINGLSKRLPPNTAIHYYTECGITLFETIISRSYVVFYWNVFSASIVLCWIYKKLFVFFQKGHMHELFGDLFESALIFYYNDYRPIYIDIFSQDIALIHDYESIHSKKFYENRIDSFNNAMSPDVVISRLISS